MAISEVQKPPAAASNVVYKAPGAEGSSFRIKPQMGQSVDTAQGTMKVRQEAPKPLEMEKGKDYSSDGIGVQAQVRASKDVQLASLGIGTIFSKPA